MIAIMLGFLNYFVDDAEIAHEIVMCMISFCFVTMPGVYVLFMYFGSDEI